MGIIKDLSKNILKHGVGKGKSCLWGGGAEGVTTLAPFPRKILIIHKSGSDDNYATATAGTFSTNLSIFKCVITLIHQVHL